MQALVVRMRTMARMVDPEILMLWLVSHVLISVITTGAVVKSCADMDRTTTPVVRAMWT